MAKGQKNGHSPEAEPDAQQPEVLTTDNISEEDVRYEADALGSMMAQVGGQDFAALLKEALSPGETPTEVLARTRVHSREDVTRLAKMLVRSAKVLRQDPIWADEPWVRMRSPRAMFAWLHSYITKSLEGEGMWIALQMQTNLLSPDLQPNSDANRDKGRRFLSRRPQQPQRY